MHAIRSRDDPDRARARGHPQHLERKIRHQVAAGENEQRHAASDTVAIRFLVDCALPAFRRRDFGQAAEQVRIGEQEPIRIGARFEHHRDARGRPFGMSASLPARRDRQHSRNFADSLGQRRFMRRQLGELAGYWRGNFRIGINQPPG